MGGRRDDRAGAPVAPVIARWRRRPGRGVLAVVVIAVALMGGWRWWQGKEVQVVEAVRQPFVERVVAAGRVMAPAEVRVSALALGRVVGVAVDQGQRAKTGQVLVELDDREARAALAQAQAAAAQAQAALDEVCQVSSLVASQRLAAAQARYALAAAEHERQQQLYQSGAVTAAGLDGVGRALEVAASERDAAQAQAHSVAAGGSGRRAVAAAAAQAAAGSELAAVRLSQLQITAPADGMVLGRQVEVGDVVSPGQTLLLLARDGSTRLTVQVDEANLGRLAPGQLARASADAFPADQFDAQVASISPGVDAARGTVEVRLDVPSPPTYLRPNMTVSVDIEVARRGNVLSVPTGALREVSSASPWVLVLREGRAVRQALRLGVHTADQTEVLGGLEPGHLVITGGEAIAQGARVHAGPPRSTDD